MAKTQSVSPEIEVGSLIRAERIRRGMSLTKLAAACGTSPSHISCIELGKTSATVGTLNKIGQALGAHIDPISKEITDATTGKPVDKAPTARKRARRSR